MTVGMVFGGFGAGGTVNDDGPFELTLSNPGFETGDLTGWTVDTPGWTVAADAETADSNHTLDGPNEFPRSGSYAAWGTPAADMVIYQEVDVSAYATEIDAGQATIWGELYGRDTFGDADRVRLELQFRDAGSTNSVGTRVGPWISDYGSWTQCAAGGAIPAGTRFIRVKVVGNRQSGSLCNVGADDVALAIHTGENGLSLSNPGFEAGDLTGWAVADAGWTVATDAETADASHSSDGPNEFPRSGTYALWGTEDPSMSIYQDVDVSGYATGIDAGQTVVRARAWFRNTLGDGDRGRVVVECGDSGHTTVLKTITGPWITTYGSWAECLASGIIPPGARNLRIIVEGDLVGGGSVTSMGADDVELALVDF